MLSLLCGGCFVSRRRGPVLGVFPRGLVLQLPNRCVAWRFRQGGLCSVKASFRFLGVFIIALLLLALGSPLSAQPDNAGLRRLQADVGPLDVTLSAETGYPSFIRGHIPVPGARAPAAPTAAARAFLMAYGSAFGIADPDAELVPVAMITDALNLTRVQWQQVVDGVPVYRALVNVHLRLGADVVYAASSGYVPNLLVPTTRPRFTARQALANALPAMPYGSLVEEPALVIYPYRVEQTARLEGRLVWTIDLLDNAIPAHNVYLVDALTGHLLEAIDLLTGATARQAAPSANDPDDGRTLSPDQPLSGDIEPVGDNDTYVFNGNTGDVITIHMWQNVFTSNLDPYLSVYGPAGGLLVTDNDGGQGDDAAVRKFTLVESGTYTVTASSFNNQESGLYTIALLRCGSDQYYAEYYNNRNLEEEPVLDRCEPLPLSHDWGYNAPEGVGQADNFSVRWSGRYNFAADTYTFAAYVDDGIRVKLDGEVILESWHDGGLRYHSADLVVSAGIHEVEVQYYERSSTAAVNLRWYGHGADSDDERTLQPRLSLTGNIWPATDTDLYYFDAEAGSIANLLMRQNLFTPFLDPYLVIVAPSGTIVATDDDSGDDDAAAISQLVLPETGRYHVRASDMNTTGIGFYAIEFWLTGLYRETYDADWGTSLPGKLVRKEGQGPVDDRDTNRAHDYAGLVYDYYETTHDRLSYDGLGGMLRSTVHYGIDYNNAFWNGEQMTYGDGMVALDVVAHELTHGVIETTANLKYEFQSGAMNESFADIFGVMVDRDDWLMGEDLAPDVLGGREAIRDMADPERFGHPSHTDDWVTTCNDNRGVHTNSGIFNKAYYNIATSLDKGRAERIFYRALVTYLHASSSLRDGRAAAIQAAVDLYGDGQEKQAVEEGFDAVGIISSWNIGQPDCGGCAVTSVAADRGLFADAITGLRTVTTLYRVRDTMLDTTPRGRHYRDLYEQHTGSITKLLAADGDLRKRGAGLLAQTQPALDDLADGQGDTIVTAALVHDVRAYLVDLAAAAEARGDDDLADTISFEITRLDFNELIGMTYDEAWDYLNLPQLTFLPVSVGR